MSFQYKNKKKLMKLRMLSKILGSIHYYLIGAMSGFASQFIGIFPNYYACKLERNKTKKHIAVIIFILLTCILGIITYKNIYDILPIIATSITIVSLFLRGTKYVREVQFIVVPMLLIYDIINMSYAGIVLDILVLVSCTIGLLRLDRKK
jgi:hypothetical protein